MTLLEFARGPALHWSLLVLVLGVLWRLGGVILLRRGRDLSKPRRRVTLWGAAATVMTRFWPHKDFRARIAYQETLGHVFHIGLALVVFGFAPHILVIKSITGLSWPALPNEVVTLASALVVFALVALLIRRLGHPVMRALSTVDDYLSWFVTLLPVVTGIFAFAHWGPDYGTLLAYHILSAELLLVYFPFSKLFHGISFAFSRFEMGADFNRRGVRP
jgi:nitrate reductase gamma subunit